MNNRSFIYRMMLALLPVMLFASCADDVTGGPTDETVNLVLSVSLPGTEGSGSVTRADFDNFDNEEDKWGKDGENLAQLRVMILDGNGIVEANAFYADLNNVTEAQSQRFPVKNHDTKTVVLVGNEGSCRIHTAEGNLSASDYFGGIQKGAYIDINELKGITLTLSENTDPADSRGKSLRKPLPITSIHSERIEVENVTGNPGEVDVERSYVMHRAAVKYSFRVINKSEKFDYTLEGIRISRVADREFLFPNAVFAENEFGHQAIKEYYTPEDTQESESSYSGFSVSLPRNMKEAVEAGKPIYVPEGLAGETITHKISVTLNGAPLDIWADLKWRMPGTDITTSKPMTDLPRNTHVVVNITLHDHTFEAVADVQPYSSVSLNPFFGLERDEDGNIIVGRNEDGSYQVIENGEIVNKDPDGDEIIKTFSDGSVYCCDRVYKDYIHDDSEIDDIYYIEKDKLGGNVIIIRQKSAGKAYHKEIVDHDHGVDDRAMYVLTKEGAFLYVTWSDDKAQYHDRDMFGDEIIQVNGQQFEDSGDMAKYIGSYVVKLSDGNEELRYYKDGSKLDWETGVESLKTRSVVKATSPARKKQILARMRSYNRLRR